MIDILRRRRVVFVSALSFWLLGTGLLVADSRPFEMTPETAQLLRNGLSQMYNYEVDEADRTFDDLIRRFPDHPIGYMHKAELIWWKALLDTKSEEFKETFRRFTEQALTKGKKALERNPRDFYALLYMAGAYGNQTRYNVYISKSYLGALSPGIKGYKYIKSAQALRRDYVDCLIGVGAYNYFAGAVPSVIKPIAWMFYAPGNKAEGIRQLEIVAAKGEFGQIEAKTVLLGIYLNEKRWADYQKLTKELIKQFPLNPVFYSWLAAPFVTQRRWDVGIQQFSELINNDNANGWKAGLAYAFHQKGRLELEKRDLETAIKSFNQVLNKHSKNENLLARTYLLRAYAHDLLGQRNSALTDYQATLNLPNVEDTHRKARQFLNKPYSGTR